MKLINRKVVSGKKLVEELRRGKNIALVSDAGLPTISDPGLELVELALEENLYVVPLPGANAALTALIASGIKTQPFYFFGFLDRQKKEKKKQLEKLKRIDATIIFYEAPHRLKETLLAMNEVLGNRNIAISRELTKKFEEFIRGDIESVLQWAKDDTVRGEFCLVVEGSSESENHTEEENWWANSTVEAHVNHYINEKDMTVKEAIKEAAKDRNLPKREIYQEYHID